MSDFRAATPQERREFAQEFVPVLESVYADVVHFDEAREFLDGMVRSFGPGQELKIGEDHTDCVRCDHGNQEFVPSYAGGGIATRDRVPCPDGQRIVWTAQ